MKRVVVAFALCACFLAVTAGPALAETRFTFSGKYTVRGFYDSNNDLSPTWDGGRETLFPAGTIIAPTDMLGTAVGTATPSNPAAVVGAWVRLDDGTVKFIDQRVPGSYTAGGVAAGVRTSSDSSTDAYVDHSLEINMKFMPSEYLALNVQLNALKEMMWGSNTSQKSWGGTDAGSGASDPEFNKVWMTIKSGYGVFDIGRMDGGVSGLQVLGAGASPVGADRYWGNSRRDADRIKWTVPVNGSLTVVGVWDRIAEGNGRFSSQAGTAYPANAGRLTNNPANAYLAYRDQSNLDVDAWTILPIYKWANGGLLVQVSYIKQEATQSRSTLPNDFATQFNAFFAASGGVLPAGGPAAAAWRYAFLNARSLSRHRETIWEVRPALRMNFGPLELNGDVNYFTGTREYSKVDKDAAAQIMAGVNSLYSGTLGVAPAGANLELKDMDLKGVAYYFDAQYRYGPGTAGLLFAYHEGDSNPNDDTDHSYLMGATNLGSSGADFKPLYAAFSDYTDYSLLGQNNYWMWSAWVDHSLTEDLILHAAYGYIRRIEKASTWFGLDGYYHAYADQSLDYGQEFDLGLSYKIMDNLTYQAHFGYFWAGDWFKLGSNNLDVGNSYHLDHTLELSF
ncbi:MAG: hypothetical protein KKB20_00275 [Proteobacteria bacterium]|nr:hypothetical protein [Pseudomonadota bacterium]